MSTTMDLHLTKETKPSLSHYCWYHGSQKFSNKNVVEYLTIKPSVTGNKPNLHPPLYDIFLCARTWKNMHRVHFPLVIKIIWRTHMAIYCSIHNFIEVEFLVFINWNIRLLRFCIEFLFIGKRIGHHKDKFECMPISSREFEKQNDINEHCKCKNYNILRTIIDPERPICGMIIVGQDVICRLELELT